MSDRETISAPPQGMSPVLMLCLPGLDNFVNDLIGGLRPQVQINKCVSKNTDELLSAIRAHSTIWLEWGNDLAIALTNDPRRPLLGKRVLCRIHSYEVLDNIVDRMDFTKIDDLIFVAPHIRDILLARKPEIARQVRRIHCIPNGIDVDRFAYREHAAGPEIAYLGSLNFKKDPMVLMHAFYRIHRANPNARLHIAGDIQQLRYIFAIENFVKQNRLEKAVLPYGWQKDVAKWLEPMNFILSSSLMEGHPVGLLEAMARGIKPLVYAFPGATCFYPEEFLWRNEDELLERLGEPYASATCRDYVVRNGSLALQCRLFLDMLAMQTVDGFIAIRTDVEARNRARLPKGGAAPTDHSRAITAMKMLIAKDRPAKKADTANTCGVSAVLAVRNGEATIARAIESLLRQTRPLSKIVVVDDASTDGTQRVVATIAKASQVPVQYVRLQANQWVFRARNIGAQQVESDFIFFLDADDYVHETYVEKLTTILEGNAPASFAYCNPVYFDGSGQKIYRVPGFDIQKLLQHNFVSQCSIIRRKAFAQIGGFSEYLNDSRNHLSEWHLWLALATKVGPGMHVDEPLFYYQASLSQMSKHYERTRVDMQAQFLSDLGYSFNIGPIDHGKTRMLLVCQGRSSLDHAKIGSDVYTWIKPLAAFGECYTFFYDIEEMTFGHPAMLQRLKAAIDRIQPSHIFHPAYQTHIPAEYWSQISKSVKTIAWFSDDNWRFDDYSRHYIKGFSLGVTTDPDTLKRYSEAGIDNVILSQWAANPEHFHDYGFARDLAVCFCGHNNVARAALLTDLRVHTFGYGWPSGLLSPAETANVLARSKIALNFAKNSAGRPRFNALPFEATACGALLLTEYTPRIEEYFATGAEVETFRDAVELKDKIAHYLAHENERVAIARAGMERTLRDHMWQTRLVGILDADHINPTRQQYCGQTVTHQRMRTGAEQ